MWRMSMIEKKIICSSMKNCAWLLYNSSVLLIKLLSISFNIVYFLFRTAMPLYQLHWNDTIDLFVLSLTLLFFSLTPQTRYLGIDIFTFSCMLSRSSANAGTKKMAWSDWSYNAFVEFIAFRRNNRLCSISLCSSSNQFSFGASNSVKATIFIFFFFCTMIINHWLTNLKECEWNKYTRIKAEFDVVEFPYKCPGNFTGRIEFETAHFLKCSRDAFSDC